MYTEWDWLKKINYACFILIHDPVNFPNIKINSFKKYNALFFNFWDDKIPYVEVINVEKPSFGSPAR